METQAHLRAALALLLVATAVLFAIGATIERSQRHKESGTAEASTTESHTGGTSSEAGNEGSSAGSDSAKKSAEMQTASSEKLFGIDVESVPAIVGGVATALVLAAAVWWRRERLWLWATLGFGLLFAAGDLREVIHQLNESNTGIAVIAGILIAAHLAISVVAGLLLSREGQEAKMPGQPS
jgi:hypothetical protein